MRRELGRLAGHGPTFILRLEGHKPLLITHLRVFIPNPVFSTPSDFSEQRFFFVGLFLSSYGSGEVASPTCSHTRDTSLKLGVFRYRKDELQAGSRPFSSRARFCVDTEHSSLRVNTAPTRHFSEISEQDK